MPRTARTAEADKAPPPTPSAVASEAAQPVPHASGRPLHHSVRAASRSIRPAGPSARPSARLTDDSGAPANPRAGRQSSSSSSSSDDLSDDSSDDSSSDDDDEPIGSGGDNVAFDQSPDLWKSPLPFTHSNPMFERPKTPPTHDDNGEHLHRPVCFALTQKAIAACFSLAFGFSACVRLYSCMYFQQEAHHCFASTRNHFDCSEPFSWFDVAKNTQFVQLRVCSIDVSWLVISLSCVEDYVIGPLELTFHVAKLRA